MPHKLLFTGDVVLASKPEFSPALRELFEIQQLRCCNFEAPLQGLGAALEKTGPLVNQSAQAPAMLKELGFDLFALANNHIMDYGPEALMSTRQALGAKNTVGAGTAEDAYGMRIREIEGVKYGFLAYAENGYGALSDDKAVGYAWVNSKRVDQDIKTYKKQVDLLIVQVHAGVEMVDVPIPEWRERYRALVDQGADVVLAHHPHVLQGMEFHQGKPIFYSLGNFYFDGFSQRKDWMVGGALELQVDAGKLVSFTMHIVEKEGALVSLMPQEQAERLFEGLNSKLGDQAAYLRYVDDIAQQQWHAHHVNYYQKGVNGLVRYKLKAIAKHFKRLVFNRGVDYNMLWHNMLIESNFWIVQRAIRKIFRDR